MSANGRVMRMVDVLMWMCRNGGANVSANVRWFVVGDENVGSGGGQEEGNC